MTSKKKDSLLSVIDSLFTVYKELDKETNLLTKSIIPKGFFQEDPNIITNAYKELKKSDSNYESTDVISKYEQKEYQSLYVLYHDIKLVSAVTIEEFKIGSKEYKDIDFFFKFATEVLLRESTKLNAQIFSEPNRRPTDLENQLNDDFSKVTYNYFATNGEAVYFLSKNQEVNTLAQSYPHLYQNHALPSQQTSQPLFTSLTGKSQIDSRESIVPEPYRLAKVISIPKNASIDNSTLESLSPIVSKIPSPTAQPTQILKDYFHPNWYTLFIPTWLNYNSKVFKPPLSSSLLKDQNESDLRLISRNSDGYKAFAPSVDSKRSIVTDWTKSNVWLNHLGFKEIQEIKKKFYGSDPVPLVSSEDSPQQVEKNGENIGSLFEEVLHPEFSVGPNSSLDPSDRKTINVEDLIEWNPIDMQVSASIEKEKDDILKSPRVLQKAISVDLLRLNKLRQERFLRSNPQNLLSVSPIETKLYKRVTKLLALALKANEGRSDLNLGLSKRISVLATEYRGVLPGISPMKNASGTKSARLPSIRGPYKKKNRQI